MVLEGKSMSGCVVTVSFSTRLFRTFDCVLSFIQKADISISFISVCFGMVRSEKWVLRVSNLVS